MNYIKIYIIVILLVGGGCSGMNHEANATPNSETYVVGKSEVTVLHGQHNLLNKAGDVVKSSTQFTYSTSFRPASEWKYSYKVEGNNESIPILKRVKGQNKIDADFFIDNKTGKDLTVSLIALHGDQDAGIRVKGNNTWSQSLVVPALNDATTQLPIEIKWMSDNKSSKELTIISFKNEDQTSSSVPAITRTLVVNQDEQITDKMLKEQEFQLEKKFTNDNLSFWPVPKLVDQNKEIIRVKKVGQRLYSINKVQSILISPVPYKTYTDVLWIEESGNVKKIAERVPIPPNKETKLELSEEQLNLFYRNKNRRQFLLFVNNRDTEMLADYKVALTKKKPFITSFSQIVEIYPLLNQN